MPGVLQARPRRPRLEHGSPPLTDSERRTGHRRKPRARPGAGPLAARAACAALLAIAVAPAGGGAQQIAPVPEDADLPPSGEVRLRAGPVLQTWHQEFGPGADGDEKVPLARDWSGPLLEQLSPGPQLLLDGLNADAGALGFEPIEADEASLGTLEVREISAEVRAVAPRLEVGLPWGFAVDVSVPLVRTEVEPFGSFDPSGANLASAGGLFASPDAFFGSVAAARSDLRARLEAGQLSGDRAERARTLLEESGAFADALRTRVEQAALIPLAGTAAGGQLLAHYGELRDGFSSFGLSLPDLDLPAEAGQGLLDFLPGDPFSPVQRGWLVGEPEVGLRFRIHDGFRPEETGGDEGLELRTAVGVRARLPLRSGEAGPFVNSADLVGLAPGDGQRDLEVSLYQDLRWNGTFTLEAVARYGVQRPDRAKLRVRSPDRPFAPASTARDLERDLGDYVRLRLAPRVVLNRFFSVGGEYRFWRKGEDRYRVLEGDGDASALELESSGSRHRVGLGAFYRPDPPAPDEARAGVPELGMVWQTALSGSGGEVPAASLVTFHLRMPIHLF